MRKMRNVWYYLKTKGIAFVIQEVISRVFFALLKLRYNATDLENIIIMESHNDFDCNCGAFYNYLIDHKLNTKYQIIWLIKNKAPQNLPYNVKTFNIDKLSFLKNYYLCRAKYILYEDRTVSRIWNEQIVVYCTHGGVTFKNVKNHLKVSDAVSYILSPSSNYDPLMCENYSIPYPNNKMLHFGYPSNDCLFATDNTELDKLTKKHYSKSVLWMPTFRISKSGRNDSSIQQPFGIPLIESTQQLFDIDDFLSKNNMLLVIKFHPMQDLRGLALPESLKNIIFIDAQKMKDYDLDVYRLMSCMDAMIGDYSSAAYSFLLLNRPLGFILSDINNYKPGLTYYSIEGMNTLPGERIISLTQLELFFAKIINNEDDYAASRKTLAKWLYDYQDGYASSRLAAFLNLES